MELINDTDLSAELFRSAPWPDRLLGMLVARATFRVDADGRAHPETEDPVPVSLKPQTLPAGDLPGDAVCRKEGVDLLVLGSAHAPEGRPVTAMDVSLSVGDFARGLTVTGARRWVQAGKRLSPGAPEPFTSLPLTWEHAFGGAADLEGKQVPNPDNPKGKGFILNEAAAEGVELPNVEDPDTPIRSWEDRPRPACFAPIPIGSYLQAENTVEFDPDTGRPKILPAFFNMAHPKHRVPELREGDPVVLTGMRPDGAPMRFLLPLARLEARVALEDRRYTFPLKADTLCLLPEEGRFAVTYRAGFTYRFVPEEMRVTRLVHAGAGA